MMRTKMILLFAVLLIAGSAFAGALEPTAAPAPTMKTLDQVEPRIPIGQADFDALPAGQGLVLDQQGASYYFTEDIISNGDPYNTDPNLGGAAIIINNFDITLDMMGFSLRQSEAAIDSGTDVEEHGIIIGPVLLTYPYVPTNPEESMDGFYPTNVSGGVAGVVVKNGTIFGYEEDGIHVRGSNNQFINVLVSSVGDDGFDCASAEQTLLKDCTAMFTCGSGIDVRNSGNILENCRVLRTGTNWLASAGRPGFVNLGGDIAGFRVGYSSRLKDCSFENGQTWGYRIEGHGNILTGCTAYNMYRGFGDMGNHNIFDGCVARQASGEGFRIEGASSIVRNCNVQGIGESAVGYSAEYANDAVLINNLARECNIGIMAGGAYRIGIKVIGNHIAWCNFGIVSQARNPVISENNLTQCGVGIYVTADYTSVSSALITKNHVSGKDHGSYSTEYSLAGSWGPIVDLSAGGGVGDMSGTTNSNHPQANFIH